MRERCGLRLPEVKMKVSELRKVADDLGQKKIIKLIEKEVAKMRKDDGTVAIADLVDGLLDAVKERKDG